MDMQATQEEIGANVREYGFWEMHESMTPTHAAAWVKLGLIGTEVSEAMETLRDLNPQDNIVAWALEGSDYHEGVKPEGLASEMADIIIRVLDMAQWLGISMAEVMEAKMAYNATRPKGHGRTA